MATTIVLKNSVTTTNTPSSLAQGEVAINVTDKKVWVGNAATTPIQIVNGGPDGVFTSVTDSGLTNTRVTYAGAGGLLKDSASITTDGTTLFASAFSGPHNGTVGATTPSTGAFTTLSASSTVSGTGFSTYLASPPAIGTTTPAAGKFTTIDATSNMAFATGTNGVTFNNTSALVNSKLNDYEEGTWTPSISPTSGSFTAGTTSGQYTKIGRLVVLQMYLPITTNGTGGGAVAVGNLPFTNNGNNAYGSGREQNVQGFGLFGYLLGSGNTIYLQKYDGTYPGGNGFGLGFSINYLANF